MCTVRAVVCAVTSTPLRADRQPASCRWDVQALPACPLLGGRHDAPTKMPQPAQPLCRWNHDRASPKKPTPCTHGRQVQQGTMRQ